MKIGNILKLLMPVFILALLVTGCNDKKEQAADSKPIFKIGMIYPLSGAAAGVGEAAQTAVKVFEQQNTDGKYDYAFVWEDNQLNAAKSAALAHKLINTDKVDAIISIGAGNASEISSIAEQNKILHFAIANTPKASSGEYNFAMATHPDKEAEKLLSEIKKRGGQNVALVTQTHSFNLAASNEIRKKAADFGINLVTDDSVNIGERDFFVLVKQIAAKKPDFVIANLYLPEISVFVKQLKDQFPEVKVTSIETFSFPEDKSLFEGYWFVDQSAANEKFANEFKQLSGKDTGNFVENVYTALELIQDSLNNVGNDKPKMIKYLQSDRIFDTALGKVKMDKDGRLESEASVKEIKNGKVVSAE